MKTKFLCSFREVVWINPNTVTPDKTRGKSEEIPLCPSCIEDIKRIDAELITDLGEFIHEGDIDITLGILDNLWSFCNLYRGCPMQSRCYHWAIYLIDLFKTLYINTGDDFYNLINCMFFVSWIDTLWTVSDLEITRALESTFALEYRETYLLSGTRINSRFIDNNLSFSHVLPDTFRCLDQWSVVRIIVLSDRSWNRDDDHICLL